MPLYEYECEACGARIERIQKFSDPLLQTCPTCGGQLRKLISSPAFQFKGSGWYITDYARKTGTDGKSSEGKDESAASKDAGKAAKSDSAASTESAGSSKESAPPAKSSESSSSSPAKTDTKS